MELPNAFERAWQARDRVARRPGDEGLFVCLAPMDGVTDHIYRRLVAELCGPRGISMCVSEFVRVTNQRVPDHVFLRHCPEIAEGGCTAHGVPVFVQLLGGLPEPLARAAFDAASLGAPGIDLNFGCPAKRVNNHDGGAALLKEPQRLETITRAVRREVPDHIPVTVKIRLGWDSAEGLVDLARAAEAGGAQWLTVHARTRKQLYKPPVDWAALARAREAISIPLVANGDLFDRPDFAACAAQSGCSDFMVGRGAMGRPRLFASLRDDGLEPLDSPSFARLLLTYLERMNPQPELSPQRGLGRLKQWLRMGAPTREDLASWFDRIKRMRSAVEARDALSAFAESHHQSSSVEPAPRSIQSDRSRNRAEAASDLIADARPV
jgi:tRNA-dihydrouridine synthase C